MTTVLAAMRIATLDGRVSVRTGGCGPSPDRRADDRPQSLVAPSVSWHACQQEVVRMSRKRMALVVVALMTVWALADSLPTRVYVVTGTVTGWQVGKWISVANETTDSSGFRISLRETTAYKGVSAAIQPGVSVTVSYHNVGERRPVANEVRVLASSAIH